MAEAAMQPAIVSLDAVRLDGHGHRVLDGISPSLRVRRTLILVPNGAGKSALLRVMHGLLAPSAGEVRWEPVAEGMPGRTAPAAASRAPRLAMVFQRPARVLSGGEQQRVALARAWALKPDVLLLPPALESQERLIVLASTSLTEQSGLFRHLLPVFEKRTGIVVRVVALGTGQALDQGRRGDADVVLVHDKAAEDQFVADGFGVARHEVMYNDFIIVGPKSDPAKARGKDVLDGLGKIVAARAPFVSCGDNSGTHAAELRYWRIAGVAIDQVKGAWHRQCGCAMGAALNTTASMNAYVLADRASWLSFKNRQDLGIVVEGDTRLLNQYGVMLVNPAKHGHVKKELGQALVDGLVSSEGQKTIAAYKIGGEALFFANAR